MKNKKGFTLIEILIVIALIAVLLLLVVPNITKTFEKTKKKMMQTEILNIAKLAKDTYTEKKANRERADGDYCDIDTERDYVQRSCEPLSIKNSDYKYLVEVAWDKVYTLLVYNDKYCYSDILHYSDTDPYAYYYYSDDNTIEAGSKFDESKLVKDYDNINCLYDDFIVCTCEKSLKAKNGVFYWNRKGAASSNYVPGSATSSYSTTENNVYIRSTVNNGNVVKHETCMYANGGLYCPSIDLLDLEVEEAKTRVKAEMEAAFGVSDVTCRKIFTNVEDFDCSSTQIGSNLRIELDYGYHYVSSYKSYVANCRAYTDGSAEC